jgi:hypothetical protein
MKKKTKRRRRGAFLLTAFAPPLPAHIGMLSQEQLNRLASNSGKRT